MPERRAERGPAARAFNVVGGAVRRGAWSEAPANLKIRRVKMGKA